MPVSKMLNSISSTELSEWRIYFKMKKDMEDSERESQQPQGNIQKTF